MQVTLLTTELEKITDALVEKKFTGGIIKIVEVGSRAIFIRDKDDQLITCWTRSVDEEAHAD